MYSSFLLAATGFSLLCASQNLRTAPQYAGPPIELVHLYYDQWPTGITVSSTGRMFSNYPPGFDGNNTNNGSNGKYTVAELVSNTTERPYPSVQINSPPGGAINYTTNPPTGANYQNYLIGVQSVVVDPLDRLWMLDTGRAISPDGVLVQASYGGAKLVGVNLTTNAVFQTIVFPLNVASPDSYLNDIRFDLRPNITACGAGIAYITDSSAEGRNGLVIVDLGSGESWRHLDSDPVVRAEQQFVPFVWGEPLYVNGPPETYIPIGADGIAISADGNDIYFGAVGSRYLYSVPSANLRDRSANSEVRAQAAVVNRGQRGVSDGFETDSNNMIYMGNMEQEAIIIYNPRNGTVSTFVRDPRLNWVDTFSVSNDGYLYFTVPQDNYLPVFWGADRRQRPFSLFRVKLPNNGTRVLLR